MDSMEEYKDSLIKFKFKVLYRLSGNMTSLTVKDLNKLLELKKDFAEFLKKEELELGIKSDDNIESKKRSIYFETISYEDSDYLNNIYNIYSEIQEVEKDMRRILE